jgi:hypothetical protein
MNYYQSNKHHYPSTSYPQTLGKTLPQTLSKTVPQNIPQTLPKSIQPPLTTNNIASK